MLKVLEVDQWTSTGNVSDFTLEDFDLQKVEGGDAGAAKVIFGGDARIREVPHAGVPSKGNVWFIPGDNGKLRLFKANYDTSG
jgi:hypothetical protein